MRASVCRAVGRATAAPLITTASARCLSSSSVFRAEKAGVEFGGFTDSIWGLSMS